MAIDPLSIITVGTSLMKTFGEFSSLRGAATGYELNAKLAETQAGGVIEQGEGSVRQQEKQADKIIGSQMLAYAKAGVKFEGSPSDVFLETSKNIRYDIIMTRLNSANRANQLGFEALQNKIAAGNARTKSIKALGSGLLDIASVIGTDIYSSNTAKKIAKAGES